MQTDAYRLGSIRIVTFALAALAAASVAYWGLRAWETRPASVVRTAADVPAASPPGPQAVARALGGGLALSPPVAGPQAAPVASRYALVGVLAGTSRKGAALISVDGQEAKPVRVGAPVDANMVLVSVSRRGAVLSTGTDATAKLTLDLPAPAN